MRRHRYCFLRKVIGIACGITGAVLIIQSIPLYVWYGALVLFVIILIAFLLM